MWSTQLPAVAYHGTETRSKEGSLAYFSTLQTSILATLSAAGSLQEAPPQTGHFPATHQLSLISTKSASTANRTRCSTVGATRGEGVGSKEAVAPEQVRRALVARGKAVLEWRAWTWLLCNTSSTANPCSRLVKELHQSQQYRHGSYNAFPTACNCNANAILNRTLFS